MRPIYNFANNDFEKTKDIIFFGNELWLQTVYSEQNTTDQHSSNQVRLYNLSSKAAHQDMKTIAKAFVQLLPDEKQFIDFKGDSS